MRFGKALHLLLEYILAADPEIGPTCLCKVDLADAYMRIWVHAEDAPLRRLTNPEGDSSQRTACWILPLFPYGIHVIRGFLLHRNRNGQGQVTC